MFVLANIMLNALQYLSQNVLYGHSLQQET